MKYKIVFEDSGYHNQMKFFIYAECRLTGVWHIASARGFNTEAEAWDYADKNMRR